MKKAKKFIYLFFFILFVIYLYSQEKCYPKFGDIFGLSNLPLQTYGFFIAMAFLFGAIFLKDELNRLYLLGKISPIKSKKESKIELIFNLFFSFFIGYQLFYIVNGNYDVFVKNPQTILSFHLDDKFHKIFFYLIGGISFTIVSYILNKKNNQNKNEYLTPPELVGTLLGVTLVSGILGAKLFYLFETEISWANLISFGGLTFYGGLICGTLGVIIFAKKNKISIPHIADAFAPILMLSYSIGRVACQVSGDGCWGIENTIEKPSFLPNWIWHSQYINGSSSGTNFIENGYYVWPTPIYESILCFIIFLFLWSIRKKIKIGGLLFSIYLILNGIERFLIEKIRVNEELIVSLTQGQIIAIFLFLTGSLLSIYLLKKNSNVIN